jgi:hypothetical protein
MSSKVIPIRLRHSNLDTLYVCKRKFQLEELLDGGNKREDTVDTVFGTAYGVGIATYFVTQDSDRALFEAWRAYSPEIENDKKNIPRMLAALMASFFIVDTLLMEYEVAYFNGMPAVELSFRLNTSKPYYFVGHVDLVLRNKLTGVYFILDAKTTGSQLLDLTPLYKHSGQALGYSIALDKIVGKEVTSYGVIYFVAQLGKEFKAKIHIINFEKTLMDRLNWFISLGMQIEQLERMEQLGFYPMEFQGCLRFNRPCPHFGTCHLHSFDIPAKRKEDLEEYQFVYNLDELITDHLSRIGRAR